MRYGWVLGLVLAGPAFGQAVTLEGCEVRPKARGPYEVACNVVNASQTPIAELFYRWRAVEAGRLVPWAEPSPGISHGIRVPGGIEPGETIPVDFNTGLLPPRADPAVVQWEVELVEARDLAGEPIR